MCVCVVCVSGRKAIISPSRVEVLISARGDAGFAIRRGGCDVAIAGFEYMYIDIYIYRATGPSGVSGPSAVRRHRHRHRQPLLRMTNLHPKYLASHVHKYHPRAHSVEVFLDYNCPFSAKMFKKLIDEVIPEFTGTETHNFVFINVVQPWHALQSGVSHDVSFAVSKVKPEAFWDFSRVLFENITNFYDSEINEKTRVQIRDEVLALYPFSEIEREEIVQLMTIAVVNADGSPSNSGNGVAADNKYFARYARTLGVHVTPTVVLNGVVLPSIESSTEASKIVEILKKA